MAEMVEDYDKNQDTIWIFLEDSYTWIGAKKVAKVKGHHKLKATEGDRIRISVGGLIEVVRKNRNIKESILYGSEPPPIDSVWKKAEEYGFKVKCYHKDEAGKEKKVDEKLVADVTEMTTRIDILQQQHAGENTKG